MDVRAQIGLAAQRISCRREDLSVTWFRLFAEATEASTVEIEQLSTIGVAHNIQTQVGNRARHILALISASEAATSQRCELRGQETDQLFCACSGLLPHCQPMVKAPQRIL